MPIFEAECRAENNPTHRSGKQDVGFVEALLVLPMLADCFPVFV